MLGICASFRTQSVDGTCYGSMLPYQPWGDNMRMLIQAVALIAAISLPGTASAQQQSSKPPPSAETLKHYECMIRNAHRIANLPDLQGAWYGMLAALCHAKPDYK